MTDRIGQQLGNYRLVSLLGRGGFAEVYLGEHVYLHNKAAVKVLHTQITEDSLEVFLTEARTLVGLVHPHIVRVLDFGLDEETPYLIMDYAPGGTLRQKYAKGTRVPLEVVNNIIQQVASALEYAHGMKVIHRDIKPENMLIGQKNEVLLTDFGIAVVVQNSRSPLGGQVVIQHEASHPQRKRKPALLLIALIAVLLVGSFATWAFLFSRSPSTTNTPASTLSTGASSKALITATTASFTPTPAQPVYPNINGNYSGTIHNTRVDEYAQMSLLINQNQSSITGEFSVAAPLLGNGSFSGNIQSNGNLRFVVTSNDTSAPILFVGAAQSNGSLSGSYCSVNPSIQCDSNYGGYGVWNVQSSS